MFLLYNNGLVFLFLEQVFCINKMKTSKMLNLIYVFALFIGKIDDIFR